MKGEGNGGAGTFGVNGDRNLMSSESKEAEYRRHAGALMDLATRAGTMADKFRLLLMASDWLKLADKIARLTQRQHTLERGYHDPLVRDRPHASQVPTTPELRD